MMVWGFGVGYWFGFLGLVFSVDGVLGDCGVGPSGFFWGWGFLYKHKRINLGKMVLRQA